MNDSYSMKRKFLHLFIGSIAISALTGIGLIALGNFGETEVKILMTSFVISAASLCGVACGALLERSRSNPIAVSGIGLALIAAVVLISGIWFEFRSEVFWKSSATVSIFAIATSHLSLLLLAQLSQRFQWAVVCAFVIVSALSLLISIMIWGEIDSEGLIRLMGILAVLSAAISILIPIFHRLSKDDLQKFSRGATIANLDREIAELELRLHELRRHRAEIADD